MLKIKSNNNLFILLIFILLFIFPINVQASPISKRLSGLNRYETAAAVALDANGFTQSDCAILASGENFPDALSAAPLAKKFNAPILLTQKDLLPTETISVLNQLKIKKITIVGGTGVVSTTVENQINAMGITTTRLSGKDRYETAIKIAEQLENVSEIAIVTGEDFPDALSISPIAVKKNMPIILIQHNVIPEVVKAYINSHKINKTYVIGAGSSLEKSSLFGLPNVEKINGQVKYQRNLAIIDKFKNELDLTTIYIASGENFPDGLSGSILAGKNSNPMLLIGEDIKSAMSYLSNSPINLNNVKILGGNAVMPDTTINNLIASSINKTALSITDIAKNVNAIVKIEVKNSDNIAFATGSGCIISSDGKLITNYHVIENAHFIDVLLQDGSKYEVDGVLGYSKTKDLAVLKLKNANNMSVVQLGDSDTLQLGNQIVAIGSPLGLQNTVSTGIISGLNRLNKREGNDIQISVPINHGSSGGGLFNMNGQVIGITYLGVNSSGDLNYAIPINDIKPLINISTLTTFAQLAPTIDLSVDPTTSLKFFPNLLNVPMPQNVDYYKTSLNDTGSYRIYFYYISTSVSEFLSNYDDLLKKNRWTLLSSGLEPNGIMTTHYKKDNNIIQVASKDEDVAIMGVPIK